MLRRGIGRVGRPSLIGTAARTAVVAGTATAVSGHVARKQQAKAEEKAEAQAYEQQQAAAAAQPQYVEAPPQYVPAPAPAPAPAAPDTSDLLSQLQQLGALRDSGVLTEAEFEAQKAKLLAG